MLYDGGILVYEGHSELLGEEGGDGFKEKSECDDEDDGEDHFGGVLIQFVFGETSLPEFLL